MTRWSGRALALAALAWCGAVAAQKPAPHCPPPLQAPTPAQMQAAAGTARDHGALWRVTRDGSSSYLFGTLHVGKLEWAVPGPRLRAALEATDTIALEIDPTDPDMAARMSGAGGGAAPALPRPLAERLSRRIDAACLPDQARPVIDHMHPLLQAVMLSVLESRWSGLDAGYAQEFTLAGFGRATQRRIVSLETPESQLEALIPEDVGEVHKAIASTLDQLDRGTTRRSIRHLAAAWARGDLAELERYERWCECVLDDVDRRLLARLVDDRNPRLAERIDALHRAGHRVLAGVGALHMVGPKGLPALLRARGFVVERVAFH